jgi:uncharacterized protein YceK
MKTKLALSLLVVALLPACTTTKTTSTSSDGKNSRYANTSMEAAPPAEGPEADIPAEGPHDVNVNPAYMPTPLLRNFAISGP